MAAQQTWGFKKIVGEVNEEIEDLPAFFSQFADILTTMTKTIYTQYGATSRYIIEVGPREKQASIFKTKGALFGNYTYRVEIMHEDGKTRLYLLSEKWFWAVHTPKLLERAFHTTYSKVKSTKDDELHKQFPATKSPPRFFPARASNFSLIPWSV